MFGIFKRNKKECELASLAKPATATVSTPPNPALSLMLCLIGEITRLAAEIESCKKSCWPSLSFWLMNGNRKAEKLIILGTLLGTLMNEMGIPDDHPEDTQTSAPSLINYNISLQDVLKSVYENEETKKKQMQTLCAGTFFSRTHRALAPHGLVKPLIVH